MQECRGNIWNIDCDGLCVTINGEFKRNGELVMGAGIAKECKILYPHTPKMLANIIKQRGFGCHVFGTHGTNGHGAYLIGFPTKYDWRENSEMELILKSAKELVAIADERDLKKVLLPRPGCGHGGLEWQHVRTPLSRVLDDRFYAISK
jgi:hypothetical protein